MNITLNLLMLMVIKKPKGHTIPSDGLNLRMKC